MDQAADFYAETRRLLRQVRRAPDLDPRPVLAEIARREAEAGGAERAGPRLAMARLIAEGLVAIEDRDRATLMALPGRIDELLPRIDNPGAADALRGFGAVVGVFARWAEGDSGAFEAAAADLRAASAGLDADNPWRDQLAALDTVISGAGAEPVGARLLRSYLIAERSNLGWAERTALGTAIAHQLLSRLDEYPQLATSAIGELRDALRRMSAGDPDRPQVLTLLGLTVLRRARDTLAMPGRWRPFVVRPSLRPRVRARADLRTGVELLEQALAEAAAPSHPGWATGAMALATAYRDAGRDAEARATGLRALRGYAWQALLQSHAAAAAGAAMRAPENAMTVAAWHIADGDAGGAAAALDAGRGLVLHAAASVDDVPALLVEAGASDLAAQWPAGEVPIELRRAAFERLTLGATLLDPPTADEIRAALARAGFDALVYLVADTHAEPAGTAGAAVVVPADGPPAVHRLPNLTAPPYLVRGGGREIGAWAPGPPDELGALCEWAWDAAIGPLLDALGHAEPRLVLVPMGELAGVPWHAARHDGRYAIERAVFSYAASARMLCRTAPAATTGPVLIVGDPDTGGAATDLAGARREALALRELYPGARYVGRLADGTPSPDGAGTPDEVLGWSGGVLHLACHGTVRERTGAGDSSFLLLAGGERLAAERLIAARGTARPGLVVLAACSSGVSGRGPDEAFSLSTAFLAGGSGAVVAAQWSVPDEATSTLMLLFHRYQRRRGLRPVDALRAAQRDLAGTDPGAWAGFVHFGR
ncbi:CHAT domain-containing protein [Dactylosporangium darangshiense]|uniref:CHAT domain-containing protein n=1 Tax=Dactylosporangium darangshiense TaxID=579108 RepID=A0ABP8CY62_9ACTN